MCSKWEKKGKSGQRKIGGNEKEDRKNGGIKKRKQKCFIGRNSHSVN